MIHFSEEDEPAPANAKVVAEEAEDEDGDILAPDESETPVIDQTLQKILQQNSTMQTVPIFAEMQELLAGRWIQTARWVKYKENADIDGGRWSAPHVASFAGKTFGCLQHLIINGICVFENDFQNLKNLSALVGRLVVNKGSYNAYIGDKLGETISAKHWHLSETFRGLREAFYKGAKVSIHQIGVKAEEEEKDELIEEIHPHRATAHFGSNLEGASIMTGVVDYLTKPLLIFLRQSKAAPGKPIKELTEIDVTMRYVVIVLGPLQRAKIMHEIGRALGTILTDSVFQVVASTATTIDDLIHGLRNFADHATLLPPDQWHPAIRINPPERVVTRREIRQCAIDYEAELEVEKELLVIDAPIVHQYEPHLPAGLQVTGRIFGGLVEDIARKAPFYKSDFSDGFTIQSFASVMFLFFIMLTQMVSFGGLMGEATGNNIAVFETIISSAVNGVLYHLFSGQPLNIISTTGPVLILERLLYNLCQSWGLQYLEFRFWVGAWMALIMLIIVMFDLSFMVCFITRFTEDSFAALIATIFIYESLKSMFKLYKHTPVNFQPPFYYTCECRPRNDSSSWWLSWVPSALNGSSPFVSEIITSVNNTFPSLFPSSNGYDSNNTTFDARDYCNSLNQTMCNYNEHCKNVGFTCNSVEPPVADVYLFSLLLFLGTFVMANLLKAFRMQPFFANKVRAVISDFAVLITIFAMVFIDYLCGISTAKLTVPHDFRPTNPDRPWLVPIYRDNPWYSILLAFPPGIFAAILLFMDHQITTVIVNRKEHLLKKGFGYHLDLFVVTVQIVICSAFGITWLVASTVLAIGHVNSLRKESETVAPGEHPKFLGIREQRLTGILIFLLIGLSIFARDLLALIPMPVCYGCFLYMGCNVLSGCEMFHRVLLFFMPIKNQPSYSYLQHVRLARVHIFTFVQVVSFIFLWILKEVNAVSMFFPLMLIVIVFIRKALDYVFTNEELHYLDDIMPPFRIPRTVK